MCLFSCACSSSPIILSNRSWWRRGGGFRAGVFWVVLLCVSGGGAGGPAGPLLTRARPRTIIVNIFISFLEVVFFGLVVCVCSLLLAHHLPLMFPTVAAGGRGGGFRVGGFLAVLFCWCGGGARGPAGPLFRRARPTQQSDAQKPSDRKKLEALEACQACKECQWTSAGTKGCKQCLGQFYNQMRLTRFNLKYYQYILQTLEQE